MDQTTNKPVFIPYKKPEEQQVPMEAVNNDEKIEDLGYSVLLSCLYFLFDAFERCGLDFFLVRDTAKKAKTSYMLEGDHIDIGVRQNEWANDQKDILFPYFEQEHAEKISELPNEIVYKWNDVKFTIHIYPDNPLLLALVPINYEHEIWKIPNNFEEFDKQYDHR